MALVNNLPVTTKEIIDYLQTHPDFFISHPELLTRLKIPHDEAGQASSLIEYQVTRLRKEIHQLKNSLEAAIARTSNNREFSATIHDFILKLAASENNRGLYTLLHQALCTYYQADRVLLLIFNNDDSSPAHPDLKFLQNNSRLALMFTEIVHRNKPLCGSLQEEHLLALFQQDMPKIKSTVLIPIKQSRWNGLLVLGSQKQDCYSHGFELDFLVFIARVCGELIASRMD